MRQEYFDTDTLARVLKIPHEEYEKLKRSVREEFPDDEMMYQLHLVRALKALSRKSDKSVNEQ